MEFKRFASRGSTNPSSRESIKRLIRSYPLKRKTFGTGKIKEKKQAIANKMLKEKPQSELNSSSH